MEQQLKNLEDLKKSLEGYLKNVNKSIEEQKINKHMEWFDENKHKFGGFIVDSVSYGSTDKDYQDVKTSIAFYNGCITEEDLHKLEEHHMIDITKAAIFGTPNTTPYYIEGFLYKCKRLPVIGKDKIRVWYTKWFRMELHPKDCVSLVSSFYIQPL